MRLHTLMLYGFAAMLGACSTISHEPLTPEISAKPEARLQNLVHSVRQKYELPALGVLVKTRGQRDLISMDGVRSIDSKNPATEHDSFHFGSDGKAMTAALIAQLVEQGKLRWDSTLAESLPGFEGLHPDFASVTVDMLLTHRAGIVDDMESLDGRDLWYKLWEPGLSPQAGRLLLAETILRHKPTVPAGKEFRYSNYGFVIAGMIVEKFYGQPYEEILPKHIWKPLGMTKTCGFGAPGNPKASEPDQPWGHKPGWIWGMNAHRPGPRKDNPGALSPAGRMHCSMEDWSKFLTSLMDAYQGLSSDFLRQDTARHLLQPYPQGDYTFGAWGYRQQVRWTQQQPIFLHMGSNTFETALVSLVPSQNSIIIIVTNLGFSSSLNEMFQDVLKGIDGILWSQK